MDEYDERMSECMYDMMNDMMNDIMITQLFSATKSPTEIIGSSSDDLCRFDSLKPR